LQRDPQSLLWDAREAAEVIATITSGKSFADFEGDIVLRSAVERQFEDHRRSDCAACTHRCRDGAESARSAADHRLSQRPDRRLRTVDPARVWRVIEDNLPPLRAALAALLAAFD
jgi:uncharacterized protein with HEPN domain